MKIIRMSACCLFLLLFTCNPSYSLTKKEAQEQYNKQVAEYQKQVEVTKNQQQETKEQLEISKKNLERYEKILDRSELFSVRYSC